VEDAAVLAFEIIGLVGVILFFAALVSGDPRMIRR
jgi:hypothetical protein